MTDFGGVIGLFLRVPWDIEEPGAENIHGSIVPFSFGRVPLGDITNQPQLWADMVDSDTGGADEAMREEGADKARRERGHGRSDVGKGARRERGRGQRPPA